MPQEETQKRRLVALLNQIIDALDCFIQEWPKGIDRAPRFPRQEVIAETVVLLDAVGLWSAAGRLKRTYSDLYVRMRDEALGKGLEGNSPEVQQLLREKLGKLPSANDPGAEDRYMLVCDDADRMRTFVRELRDDLKLPPSQGKKDDPTETQATHSEPFTSVDWFGTRYEFTKGNQAESIRVLWEAWENGGHGLSELTIGDKIGSAANKFRLGPTFRKKNKRTGKHDYHPAWGTMIQPASKGSFRLAPPNTQETSE